MDKIISAFEDDLLGFKSCIQPRCQFFLVKNKCSECISLSQSLSQIAGYANPIDYLGKTDMDLKCQALYLAETFIQQDKEVINNKSNNIYVVVSTFYDAVIKIYLWTKKFYNANVVCNGWALSHGPFFEYFNKYIHQPNIKYYNKMHMSYKVIDFYDNLSLRESQVLFFLMQQLSSTEIGHVIHLSRRTVQHYIINIKSKMHCQTTSQVIQLSKYLGYHSLMPESLLRGAL